MREYCVYCGKKIECASKEHIIHNALGGLYESEEICCSECNGIISEKIDVPFTKIFNSIISVIPDMVKTNNTKGKPTCKGWALYNNKVYEVNLKGNKVISCPELNKQLKCKIPSSEFTILGYDFSIDNRSFKNGMEKIAFNFALDSGIPIDTINSELNIEKDINEKIINIQFNYHMIPFFPLNPFDYYIELETEMELYHALILFNQGSNLWCYIDLFNTFQYYVLLSSSWNSKKSLYKTYVQLLQKLDRDIPEFEIHTSKEMQMLARMYDVEVNLDYEKFKSSLVDTVRKKSQRIDFANIICPQDYLIYVIEKYGRDRLKHWFPYRCFLVYFNDNNTLKEKKFRTHTFDPKTKSEVSYPGLIDSLMEEQSYIRHYTGRKFKRLNDYLLNLQNREVEDIK